MGKTMGYENTEDGWVIKSGAEIPDYAEKRSGPLLSLSSPRRSLAVLNIGYLSVYGLAHLQISVKSTNYASVRIHCIPGDFSPEDHSCYAAS